MSKDSKKTDSQNPRPAPAAPSAGPQTMLMVGVVIIVAVIGFVVWLIATDRGGAGAGAGNETAEANQAAPAAPAPTPGGGRLLPSGLRIEIIRAGSGPLVTPTDSVHFRYELRRYGSSEVIESNFDRPEAAVMPVTGLVPGFGEGLTYMRAGGEARFWVPPRLGYGEAVPPGSPFGPNDTLEFRVRVERIVVGPRPDHSPGSGATPANDAAPIPVPGQ
jgi:hypothetical protein